MRHCPATLPRSVRRCRRCSRRSGPRRTFRRRLRSRCRHTRSCPSSADRTPRARSASSTSQDRRGQITDRPCRGHNPELKTTKNIVMLIVTFRVSNVCPTICSVFVHDTMLYGIRPCLVAYVDDIWDFATVFGSFIA